MFRVPAELGCPPSLPNGAEAEDLLAGPCSAQRAAPPGGSGADRGVSCPQVLAPPRTRRRTAVWAPGPETCVSSCSPCCSRSSPRYWSCPPDRPGRLQRERHRLREPAARAPRERLGHRRRRRLLHPGLRHPDQRQRRRADRLQDRHRRPRLLDQDLPTRLLPGQRGARGRHRRRRRRPPPAASRPAPPTRRPRSTTAAPGRSRPPGTCRPRPCPGSTSPASIRGDTGGDSHIPFIVRNDGNTSTVAVPDLRHHLAGLQQLRRLELLPRRAPTAAPTSSATTGRSPPAATSTVGTSCSPTSTR